MKIKLRVVKKVSLAAMLFTLGCERSAFDSHMKVIDPEASPIETPSQTHSKMRVSEGNVADGITPAEVTIEIKSESNKPIRGISMSLWVSGTQNVIVPCTETNVDGLASCRVYSTQPEEKKIVASGSITLAKETMFAPVKITKSSVSIVSSGEQHRLPIGHRVISTLGIYESPGVVKDTNNSKRIHTSILGTILDN